MENTYSEPVNEGKRGTKFQWTAEEDDKLVECLLELAGDVKWKAENGFKAGFTAKLEELLEKKLPGCGIKASPHIESRYKTLRKQYRAIADMLGPNASGFGWNDNEKMVVVEKQIFEDWVKGHPDAKGLRNKRFPHFDDLALVFGKDRASGDRAQHAIDATEELARGQENQSPTNEAEIEKNAGIGEINGNDSGSQTQIPNQGSSSKNLNRKRPRSNDELIETLMETMKDFGKKYEETNGHMATIASCFKIESEEAERRMKVFNELLKIEGLSISERIKAGELLTADTRKCDFFYSLPGDVRYDYVIQVLTDAGVNTLYM
ncbi:hypothetical protein ACB098_02G086300 [Castanea mollissima]